jgi:hypothetical protein
VHVRSAEEVLSELRRRRAGVRASPTRPPSHAALVAPLAAALDADPERAAAVARLGRRVAFVLSEPEAGFVLDARGPHARVRALDGRDPTSPSA